MAPLGQQRRGTQATEQSVVRTKQNDKPVEGQELKKKYRERCEVSDLRSVTSGHRTAGFSAIHYRLRDAKPGA